MNICVICGKEFEPTKNYMERKTCSKECYKIHSRNIMSINYIEKQFEKGHIPFNKGKPQTEWLSQQNIEKCKQTYIQNQKNAISKFSNKEGRFLPHNTLQKGTVTRRKHTHNKGKNKGKVEYEYFINIDWKGNRKPNNLFRRYLWEVYHQQDVPKGYVVHCIDGNPENIEIDNLEIITRGQLALLNKFGYIERN